MVFSWPVLFLCRIKQRCRVETTSIHRTTWQPPNSAHIYPWVWELFWMCPKLIPNQDQIKHRYFSDHHEELACACRHLAHTSKGRKEAAACRYFAPPCSYSKLLAAALCSLQVSYLPSLFSGPLLKASHSSPRRQNKEHPWIHRSRTWAERERECCWEKERSERSSPTARSSKWKLAHTNRSLQVLH